MSGAKIIEGLKDAVAGNFASITIEGQRWVRVDAPASNLVPDKNSASGFRVHQINGPFASPMPVSDPGMGWQPIETAPKDGTPVLIAECNELTNGKSHWYIDTAVNCYEVDVREIDVWTARESSEVVCYSPTHWMPLPAPPVHANQGAGR